MTTHRGDNTADAAFHPDPTAGAGYARDWMQAAGQTIAAETTKQPTDRSAGAVSAALANAGRWYDALCRHGLASPDDHTQMDGLRIAAARCAETPQPAPTDWENSNDLLQLGAAALGGGIIGSMLGDIFD